MTGDFLESLIEGRFRIEADLGCDVEDRAIWFLDQQARSLVNPDFIDEIKEALAKMLIEDM